MNTTTACTKLITLALLIAAFFSWKTYNPEKHDPDYAFYQVLKNGIARHFSRIPEKRPELLIAHNALAEYLTFELKTDVMPWLPEYSVDSSRLWRVAAGIPPSFMQHYFSNEIPADKVIYLGGGYHLLPEHNWQKVIQKAKTEQDSDFLIVAYSWQNPHQIRPGWLLKKKQ